MSKYIIPYDLRASKKSDVWPTNFQSSFHNIQNRYVDHFIFTDGSKESDCVRYTVICGRHNQMDQLPDK